MTKGRDKNLIELRDEALCRRYYYWTEVQRLRCDDARKVLSRQGFFISEERIMSIIRRKCRELKDLEVKPCLLYTSYVPPGTGKRCLPSVRHDPMSEGGSKGCKTPSNSCLLYTSRCV